MCEICKKHGKGDKWYFNPKNYSKEKYTEIKNELVEIVGSNNIFNKKVQRLCYRFGNVVEYRLSPPAFIPDFIVKPRSTKDVSSILKLANNHKIPVVVWGGGTDFTGANSPIRGGIVIDMKLMDKVIVNPDEFSVTAGAGAILSKISDEAENMGLIFPHEITTQDSATLGGAISTNSFGIRSGRYRSIENLILGIEVVLPTGDILKKKSLFKESTGYNITSLVVGSEGTLGVITEATLRLLPKHGQKDLFFFIFGSFEDGFEAGKDIHKKITPDFFNLSEMSFLKYSDFSLEFIQKYCNSQLISKYLQSKYIRPNLTGVILEKILHIAPPARKFIKYIDDTISGDKCLTILTVGFEGAKKEISAKKHILKDIAVSHGGLEFTDESYLEKRADILSKLKEVIFDYFPEQSQDFTLITFDFSLPIMNIIEIRNRIYSILETYEGFYLLDLNLYSHLSTLGVDVMMEPSGKERYNDILLELKKEVLSLNGSLSFAHGIGTRFSPFLEEDVGGMYIKFMKKIKKCLDPNNILNPGKLGDIP